MRRKRKPIRVRGRSTGFFVEDYDYLPVEPSMVGSAASDWGPLDTPRHWPWKKPKETKPAFGFGRALEQDL